MRSTKRLGMKPGEFRANERAEAEQHRQELSEQELAAIAAAGHALGCRCGFCLDGQLIDRRDERRLERRADRDLERGLWL